MPSSHKPRGALGNKLKLLNSASTLHLRHFAARKSTPKTNSIDGPSATTTKRTTRKTTKKADPIPAFENQLDQLSSHIRSHLESLQQPERLHLQLRGQDITDQPINEPPKSTKSVNHSKSAGDEGHLTPFEQQYQFVPPVIAEMVNRARGAKHPKASSRVFQRAYLSPKLPIAMQKEKALASPILQDPDSNELLQEFNQHLTQVNHQRRVIVLSDLKNAQKIVFNESNPESGEILGDQATNDAVSDQYLFPGRQLQKSERLKKLISLSQQSTPTIATEDLTKSLNLTGLPEFAKPQDTDKPTHLKKPPVEILIQEMNGVLSTINLPPDHITNLEKSYLYDILIKFANLESLEESADILSKDNAPQDTKIGGDFGNTPFDYDILDLLDTLKKSRRKILLTIAQKYQIARFGVSTISRQVITRSQKLTKRDIPNQFVNLNTNESSLAESSTPSPLSDPHHDSQQLTAITTLSTAPPKSQSIENLIHEQLSAANLINQKASSKITLSKVSKDQFGIAQRYADGKLPPSLANKHTQLMALQKKYHQYQQKLHTNQHEFQDRIKEYSRIYKERQSALTLLQNQQKQITVQLAAQERAVTEDLAKKMSDLFEKYPDLNIDEIQTTIRAVQLNLAQKEKMTKYPLSAFKEIEEPSLEDTELYNLLVEINHLQTILNDIKKHCEMIRQDDVTLQKDTNYSAYLEPTTNPPSTYQNAFDLLEGDSSNSAGTQRILNENNPRTVESLIFPESFGDDVTIAEMQNGEDDSENGQIDEFSHPKHETPLISTDEAVELLHELLRPVELRSENNELLSKHYFSLSTIFESLDDKSLSPDEQKKRLEKFEKLKKFLKVYAILPVTEKKSLLSQLDNEDFLFFQQFLSRLSMFRYDYKRRQIRGTSSHHKFRSFSLVNHYELNKLRLESLKEVMSKQKSDFIEQNTLIGDFSTLIEQKPAAILAAQPIHANTKQLKRLYDGLDYSNEMMEKLQLYNSREVERGNVQIIRDLIESGDLPPDHNELYKLLLTNNGLNNFALSNNSHIDSLQFYYSSKSFNRISGHMDVLSRNQHFNPMELIKHDSNSSPKDPIKRGKTADDLYNDESDSINDPISSSRRRKSSVPVTDYLSLRQHMAFGSNYLNRSQQLKTTAMVWKKLEEIISNEFILMLHNTDTLNAYQSDSISSIALADAQTGTGSRNTVSTLLRDNIIREMNGKVDVNSNKEKRAEILKISSKISPDELINSDDPDSTKYDGEDQLDLVSKEQFLNQQKSHLLKLKQQQHVMKIRQELLGLIQLLQKLPSINTSNNNIDTSQNSFLDLLLQEENPTLDVDDTISHLNSISQKTQDFLKDDHHHDDNESPMTLFELNPKYYTSSSPTPGPSENEDHSPLRTTHFTPYQPAPYSVFKNKVVGKHPQDFDDAHQTVAASHQKLNREKLLIMKDAVNNKIDLDLLYANNFYKPHEDDTIYDGDANTIDESIAFSPPSSNFSHLHEAKKMSSSENEENDHDPIDLAELLSEPSEEALVNSYYSHKNDFSDEQTESQSSDEHNDKEEEELPTRPIPLTRKFLLSNLALTSQKHPQTQSSFLIEEEKRIAQSIGLPGLTIEESQQDPTVGAIEASSNIVSELYGSSSDYLTSKVPTGKSIFEQLQELEIKQQHHREQLLSSTRAGAIAQGASKSKLIKRSTYDSLQQLLMDDDSPISAVKQPTVNRKLTVLLSKGYLKRPHTNQTTPTLSPMSALVPRAKVDAQRSSASPSLQNLELADDLLDLEQEDAIVTPSQPRTLRDTSQNRVSYILPPSSVMRAAINKAMGTSSASFDWAQPSTPAHQLLHVLSPNKDSINHVLAARRKGGNIIPVEPLEQLTGISEGQQLDSETHHSFPRRAPVQTGSPTSYETLGSFRQHSKSQQGTTSSFESSIYQSIHNQFVSIKDQEHLADLATQFRRKAITFQTRAMRNKQKQPTLSTGTDAHKSQKITKFTPKTHQLKEESFVLSDTPAVSASSSSPLVSVTSSENTGANDPSSLPVITNNTENEPLSQSKPLDLTGKNRRLLRNVFLRRNIFTLTNNIASNSLQLKSFKQSPSHHPNLLPGSKRSYSTRRILSRFPIFPSSSQMRQQNGLLSHCLRHGSTTSFATTPTSTEEVPGFNDFKGSTLAKPSQSPDAISAKPRFNAPQSDVCTRENTPECSALNVTNHSTSSKHQQNVEPTSLPKTTKTSQKGGSISSKRTSMASKSPVEKTTPEITTETTPEETKNTRLKKSTTPKSNSFTRVSPVASNYSPAERRRWYIENILKKDKYDPLKDSKVKRRIKTFYNSPTFVLKTDKPAVSMPTHGSIVSALAAVRAPTPLTLTEWTEVNAKQVIEAAQGARKHLFSEDQGRELLERLKKMEDLSKSAIFTDVVSQRDRAEGILRKVLLQEELLNEEVGAVKEILLRAQQRALQEHSKLKNTKNSGYNPKAENNPQNAKSTVVSAPNETITAQFESLFPKPKKSKTFEQSQKTVIKPKKYTSERQAWYDQHILHKAQKQPKTLPADEEQTKLIQPIKTYTPEQQAWYDATYGKNRQTAQNSHVNNKIKPYSPSRRSEKTEIVTIVTDSLNECIDDNPVFSQNDDFLTMTLNKPRKVKSREQVYKEKVEKRAKGRTTSCEAFTPTTVSPYLQAQLDDIYNKDEEIDDDNLLLLLDNDQLQSKSSKKNKISKNQLEQEQKSPTRLRAKQKVPSHLLPNHRIKLISKVNDVIDQFSQLYSFLYNDIGTEFLEKDLYFEGKSLSSLSIVQKRSILLMPAGRPTIEVVHVGEVFQHILHEILTNHKNFASKHGLDLEYSKDVEQSNQKSRGDSAIASKMLCISLKHQTNQHSYEFKDLIDFAKKDSHSENDHLNNNRKFTHEELALVSKYQKQSDDSDAILKQHLLILDDDSTQTHRTFMQPQMTENQAQRAQFSQLKQEIIFSRLAYLASPAERLSTPPTFDFANNFAYSVVQNPSNHTGIIRYARDNVIIEFCYDYSRGFSDELFTESEMLNKNTPALQQLREKNIENLKERKTAGNSSLIRSGILQHQQDNFLRGLKRAKLAYLRREEKEQVKLLRLEDQQLKMAADPTYFPGKYGKLAQDRRQMIEEQMEKQRQEMLSNSNISDTKNLTHFVYHAAINNLNFENFIRDPKQQNNMLALLSGEEFEKLRAQVDKLCAKYHYLMPESVKLDDIDENGENIEKIVQKQVKTIKNIKIMHRLNFPKDILGLHNQRLLEYFHDLRTNPTFAKMAISPKNRQKKSLRSEDEQDLKFFLSTSSSNKSTHTELPIETNTIYDIDNDLIASVLSPHDYQTYSKSKEHLAKLLTLLSKQHQDYLLADSTSSATEHYVDIQDAQEKIKYNQYKKLNKLKILRQRNSDLLMDIVKKEREIKLLTTLSTASLRRVRRLVNHHAKVKKLLQSRNDNNANDQTSDQQKIKQLLLQNDRELIQSTTTKHLKQSFSIAALSLYEENQLYQRVLQSYLFNQYGKFKMLGKDTTPPQTVKEDEPKSETSSDSKKLSEKVSITEDSTPSPSVININSNLYRLSEQLIEPRHHEYLYQLQKSRLLEFGDGEMSSEFIDIGDPNHDTEEIQSNHTQQQLRQSKLDDISLKEQFNQLFRKRRMFKATIHNTPAFEMLSRLYEILYRERRRRIRKQSELSGETPQNDPLLPDEHSDDQWDNGESDYEGGTIDTTNDKTDAINHTNFFTSRKSQPLDTDYDSEVDVERYINTFNDIFNPFPIQMTANARNRSEIVDPLHDLKNRMFILYKRHQELKRHPNVEFVHHLYSHHVLTRDIIHNYFHSNSQSFVSFFSFLNDNIIHLHENENADKENNTSKKTLQHAYLQPILNGINKLEAYINPQHQTKQNADETPMNIDDFIASVHSLIQLFLSYYNYLNNIKQLDKVTLLPNLTTPAHLFSALDNSSNVDTTIDELNLLLSITFHHEFVEKPSEQQSNNQHTHHKLQSLIDHTKSFLSQYQKQLYLLSEYINSYQESKIGEIIPMEERFVLYMKSQRISPAQQAILSAVEDEKQSKVNYLHTEQSPLSKSTMYRLKTVRNDNQSGFELDLRTMRSTTIDDTPYRFDPDTNVVNNMSKQNEYYNDQDGLVDHVTLLDYQILTPRQHATSQLPILSRRNNKENNEKLMKLMGLSTKLHKINHNDSFASSQLTNLTLYNKSLLQMNTKWTDNIHMKSILDPRILQQFTGETLGLESPKKIAKYMKMLPKIPIPSYLDETNGMKHLIYHTIADKLQSLQQYYQNDVIREFLIPSLDSAAVQVLSELNEQLEKDNTAVKQKYQRTSQTDLSLLNKIEKWSRVEYILYHKLKKIGFFNNYSNIFSDFVNNTTNNLYDNDYIVKNLYRQQYECAVTLYYEFTTNSSLFNPRLDGHNTNNEIEHKNENNIYASKIDNFVHTNFLLQRPSERTMGQFNYRVSASHAEMIQQKYTKNHPAAEVIPTFIADPDNDPSININNVEIPESLLTRAYHRLYDRSHVNLSDYCVQIELGQFDLKRSDVDDLLIENNISTSKSSQNNSRHPLLLLNQTTATHYLWRKNDECYSCALPMFSDFRPYPVLHHEIRFLLNHPTTLAMFKWLLLLLSRDENDLMFISDQYSSLDHALRGIEQSGLLPSSMSHNSHHSESFDNTFSSQQLSENSSFAKPLDETKTYSSFPTYRLAATVDELNFANSTIYNERYVYYNSTTQHIPRKDKSRESDLAAAHLALDGDENSGIDADSLVNVRNSHVRLTVLTESTHNSPSSEFFSEDTGLSVEHISSSSETPDLNPNSKSQVHRLTGSNGSDKINHFGEDLSDHPSSDDRLIAPGHSSGTEEFLETINYQSAETAEFFQKYKDQRLDQIFDIDGNTREMRNKKHFQQQLVDNDIKSQECLSKTSMFLLERDGDGDEIFPPTNRTHSPRIQNEMLKIHNQLLISQNLTFLNNPPHKYNDFGGNNHILQHNIFDRSPHNVVNGINELLYHFNLSSQSHKQQKDPPSNIIIINPYYLQYAHESLTHFIYTDSRTVSRSLGLDGHYNDLSQHRHIKLQHTDFVNNEFTLHHPHASDGDDDGFDTVSSSEECDHSEVEIMNHLELKKNTRKSAKFSPHFSTEFDSSIVHNNMKLSHRTTMLSPEDKVRGKIFNDILSEIKHKNPRNHPRNEKYHKQKDTFSSRLQTMDELSTHQRNTNFINENGEVLSSTRTHITAKKTKDFTQSDIRLATVQGERFKLRMQAEDSYLSVMGQDIRIPLSLTHYNPQKYSSSALYQSLQDRLCSTFSTPHIIAQNKTHDPQFNSENSKIPIFSLKSSDSKTNTIELPMNIRSDRVKYVRSDFKPFFTYIPSAMNLQYNAFMIHNPTPVDAFSLFQHEESQIISEDLEIKMTESEECESESGSEYVSLEQLRHRLNVHQREQQEQKQPAQSSPNTDILPNNILEALKIDSSSKDHQYHEYDPNQFYEDNFIDCEIVEDSSEQSEGGPDFNYVYENQTRNHKIISSPHRQSIPNSSISDTVTTQRRQFSSKSQKLKQKSKLLSMVKQYSSPSAMSAMQSQIDEIEENITNEQSLLSQLRQRKQACEEKEQLQKVHDSDGEPDQHDNNTDADMSSFELSSLSPFSACGPDPDNELDLSSNGKNKPIRLLPSWDQYKYQLFNQYTKYYIHHLPAPPIPIRSKNLPPQIPPTPVPYLLPISPQHEAFVEHFSLAALAGLDLDDAITSSQAQLSPTIKTQNQIVEAKHRASLYSQFLLAVSGKWAGNLNHLTLSDQLDLIHMSFVGNNFSEYLNANGIYHSELLQNPLVYDMICNNDITNAHQLSLTNSVLQHSSRPRRDLVAMQTIPRPLQPQFPTSLPTHRLLRLAALPQHIGSGIATNRLPSLSLGAGSSGYFLQADPSYLFKESLAPHYQFQSNQFVQGTKKVFDLAFLQTNLGHYQQLLKHPFYIMDGNTRNSYVTPSLYIFENNNHNLITNHIQHIDPLFGTLGLHGSVESMKNQIILDKDLHRSQKLEKSQDKQNQKQKNKDQGDLNGFQLKNKDLIPQQTIVSTLPVNNFLSDHHNDSMTGAYIDSTTENHIFEASPLEVHQNEILDALHEFGAHRINFQRSQVTALFEKIQKRFAEKFNPSLIRQHQQSDRDKGKDRTKREDNTQFYQFQSLYETLQRTWGIRLSANANIIKHTYEIVQQYSLSLLNVFLHFNQNNGANTDNLPLYPPHHKAVKIQHNTPISDYIINTFLNQDSSNQPNHFNKHQHVYMLSSTDASGDLGNTINTFLNNERFTNVSIFDNIIMADIQVEIPISPSVPPSVISPSQRSRSKKTPTSPIPQPQTKIITRTVKIVYENNAALNTPSLMQTAQSHNVPRIVHDRNNNTPNPEFDFTADHFNQSLRPIALSNIALTPMRMRSARVGQTLWDAYHPQDSRTKSPNQLLKQVQQELALTEILFRLYYHNNTLSQSNNSIQLQQSPPQLSYQDDSSLYLNFPHGVVGDFSPLLPISQLNKDNIPPCPHSDLKANAIHDDEKYQRYGANLNRRLQKLVGAVKSSMRSDVVGSTTSSSLSSTELVNKTGFTREPIQGSPLRKRSDFSYINKVDPKLDSVLSQIAPTVTLGDDYTGSDLDYIIHIHTLPQAFSSDELSRLCINAPQTPNDSTTSTRAPIYNLIVDINNSRTLPSATSLTQLSTAQTASEWFLVWNQLHNLSTLIATTTATSHNIDIANENDVIVLQDQAERARHMKRHLARTGLNRIAPSSRAATTTGGGGNVNLSGHGTRETGTVAEFSAPLTGDVDKDHINATQLARAWAVETESYNPITPPTTLTSGFVPKMAPQLTHTSADYQNFLILRSKYEKERDIKQQQRSKAHKVFLRDPTKGFTKHLQDVMRLYDLQNIPSPKMSQLKKMAVSAKDRTNIILNHKASLPSRRSPWLARIEYNTRTKMADRVYKHFDENNDEQQFPDGFQIGDDGDKFDSDFIPSPQLSFIEYGRDSDTTLPMIVDEMKLLTTPIFNPNYAEEPTKKSRVRDIRISQSVPLKVNVGKSSHHGGGKNAQDTKKPQHNTSSQSKFQHNKPFKQHHQNKTNPSSGQQNKNKQ